jgi:hypothetical protein
MKTARTIGIGHSQRNSGSTTRVAHATLGMISFAGTMIHASKPARHPTRGTGEMCLVKRGIRERTPDTALHKTHMTQK